MHPSIGVPGTVPQSIGALQHETMMQQRLLQHLAIQQGMMGAVQGNMSQEGMGHTRGRPPGVVQMGSEHQVAMMPPAMQAMGTQSSAGFVHNASPQGYPVYGNTQ